MQFTYKQIWLINYPVMISLLMEQLINLTDTLFLGHVGETELGACALANMYCTAIYMLGLGFSHGLQVMIARQNGEGNHRLIGKSFCQGILFQTLLALSLLTLSKLFSPYILSRLIHSTSIYQATLAYVDWRVCSFLFAFPLLAIRAFYLGTTRTGILTPNAILMVVSNIILNYLLIFGKAGFPRLGIAGAAIASTLAELIALVFLTVHMYRHLNRRQYGINFRPDWPLMGELLSLSIWTMIRSFLCIAPWFLFFIAIEHLGETQLAAANIVRSISMIFFIVVNSFATTNISLVGNLIGNQAQQWVIPVCRKVIQLGYAIGIPLIATAALLSRPLLGLFTTNTTVIEAAYAPFMVMLSTYLLSVPAYTYCNAVIGTGHTRRAFTYQVITMVCYLSYLYFLSQCHGIPLALYWTSEQLYVILLFALSRQFMRRY